MYRYIKSAGYHGYSMSNNAVAAYEDGEMPLSKWTKTAILNELVEQEANPDIIALAKKMTVAQLKDIFLYKSSWHHTSKMYNRTDFYSVNPDVPMDVIETALNTAEPTKEVKPSYDMAEVSWGEWEGSRNHPKLVNYEGYAIIKEPWAYVVDKYGSVSKKKTSGKHFSIDRYLTDVPQGQEETFNKIKSYLGE